MNNIILGIIAYVAGLITGIVAGRFYYSKNDKNVNSDMVLVVVTIIWALSMIIDIASPVWETPVAVHGIMGIIVGFFYRSTKNV